MALDPENARLEGRVVVVTGAAVGIGSAVAEGCARFGADLALCDRDGSGMADTARAVEAAGRRVVTALLDVRDAAAVGEFAREVASGFGHADVLVNNAGGGFQADFLDVSAKGQEALVHENFSSVTHCVRAFVPLIPEAGGSIVNVTSVEAHRAAPGFAVYSAMKAAVANLTKSLALELADRRIRVNCVAPDRIATPGIGPLGEGRTPLPRPGSPDDVAGAVVFLASDLSRFVTGVTLHVDGGTLAAGGWRRARDGGFEV
ncbi:MAG: short-chain dehydrogenase [Deltaproteobacteria bacterium]|nr:short-chain dehydrogenase [Deltaproteobacteria bacterium]